MQMPEKTKQNISERAQPDCVHASRQPSLTNNIPTPGPSAVKNQMRQSNA